MRWMRPATESLDTPSNRPGFSEQGIVSKLSDSVTHGDGPDPRLAPLHAESARLAEVMNRLSLNGFKSTEPFTVTLARSIGNYAAATSAGAGRQRAQGHRCRRALLR